MKEKGMGLENGLLNLLFLCTEIYEGKDYSVEVEADANQQDFPDTQSPLEIGKSKVSFSFQCWSSKLVMRLLNIYSFDSFLQHRLQCSFDPVNSNTGCWQS